MKISKTEYNHLLRIFSFYYVDEMNDFSSLFNVEIIKDTTVKSFIEFIENHEKKEIMKNHVFYDLLKIKLLTLKQIFI